MDSLNPQHRPSARPAAVVEAPTLKDALRQVRQRYGEDARVIRSRTLTRRQPDGLGAQKVVEVLVEPVASHREQVKTVSEHEAEAVRVGRAEQHQRGWEQHHECVQQEVRAKIALVRQLAKMPVNDTERPCKQPYPQHR